MKVKLLCAFTAVVLASACSNNTSILEGNWVEHIPGMEDRVQGFSLEKDGQASSINMATLRYEAWQRQGDKLILSGISIGNGVSSNFSDTYTIEKITADKLILKRGAENKTFTREQ